MSLFFCWFCCCWSFILVPGQCRTTSEKDVSLLYRALDALTRGLHYMEKAIKDVHIDAVFCVRLLEEQLQAFLKFQPDVFKEIHFWVEGLRKRARRIADRGRNFIYKGKQSKSTIALGFLLSPNKKLLWYPSTSTSAEATVVPVPCKHSMHNGTLADSCFSQISTGGVCPMSPSCIKYSQATGLRGYALTHQVLFWELMEARNCINKASLQLRREFCSNVLRDAKEAEMLNFPVSYRDLFMEQIGLCGIWGFRDFNKREWLDQILKWQRSSGCYDGEITSYPCTDDLPTVTHTRVKRTEKIMSDGCLAHKTAVALLALVASIRFEAEKIFSGQEVKKLYE
ncbi:hypothetical protein JTE90_002945 [Oedothorax gibbosus]|uniref:Uncharacterized protein n=1 Tax=Oedothorax gibbosus TaxID=931172 RepID=A0AAV6UHJ6_9ARAC|nr:hypothetical protein JTE90_002945 [Oedothorax gibbosus]